METVTIRPETTWDLTGNFWGNNLPPSSLDNAPPNTPVSSGSFTSPASFSCRFAGSFVLRFRADISLDETWEYTYSPELFGIVHDRSSNWFSHSRSIANASGECVVPPTATPLGFRGTTN